MNDTVTITVEVDGALLDSIKNPGQSDEDVIREALEFHAKAAKHKSPSGESGNA